MNNDFIKSNLHSDEKIPEKINQIFNEFENKVRDGSIENELYKNKTKHKKSYNILVNKIIGILTLLFFSGNIVAFATGNDNVFTRIAQLFNINASNYNQSTVDLNKEQSNNGIVVDLLQAGIDENTLILTYNLKTNQKVNTEDFSITSKDVLNNINIYQESVQVIKNDDENYTVYVLYVTENLSGILKNANIKTNITNIGGISGNWNFEFTIDESKITNYSQKYVNLNLDYKLLYKSETENAGYTLNYVKVAKYSSILYMVESETLNDNYNQYSNIVEQKLDYFEDVKYVIKDHQGNILANVKSKYNHSKNDENYIEKIVLPNIETMPNEYNNLVIETYKNEELVDTSLYNFINKDLDANGETDVLNTDNTSMEYHTNIDMKTSIGVVKDFQYNENQLMYAEQCILLSEGNNYAQQETSGYNTEILILRFKTYDEVKEYLNLNNNEKSTTNTTIAKNKAYEYSTQDTKDLGGRTANLISKTIYYQDKNTEDWITIEINSEESEYTKYERAINQMLDTIKLEK